VTGDVETLSLAELDAVTGGAWWNTALKVAGRVGGKLVPFVNAGVTAYSAYEGASAYNDARKRGAGVGESLWEGAKAFVIGR
jgi:hypothetical protein